MVVFAEVERVPVFCNVLWPTRAEALAAPRGDVRLGFCAACGMITNLAFDPELVRYSPAYENSLHFSAAFDRFARELAQRLVERYGLHGKDVVDIGCGDGEFLALLCEGTENRGWGFDPSYRGNGRADGVQIVREYYGATHAASAPADFVACRHVIEHLPDPSALLSILPAAPVYFEMPDGAYMLRETAIWDVIYEHVSYFTPPALQGLFASAGLGTLDLGSSFGGQYLWIEASRDAAAEPAGGADALAPLVDAFRLAHREKIDTWSERLTAMLDAGERVALWGVGSKGVTFLSLVEGGDRVELAVDLNSRKHGRHVPGTGQEIRDPSALRDAGVDVVLAMNRLYEGEIRERLRSEGVPARVVTV